MSTTTTILVVDDNPFVLKAVSHVLCEAGFNLVSCSSGEDAIKQAAAFKGKIDLLLSDVRMPGMTGPKLAEALKVERPEMHVMFMSGFTGGDLLVLNYGWAFIEKPFVPQKLIEMITIVLTSADRSQGPHQYDSHIDDEAMKAKAKAEGKAEGIAESNEIQARLEAERIKANGLITKE